LSVIEETKIVESQSALRAPVTGLTQHSLYCHFDFARENARKSIKTWLSKVPPVDVRHHGKKRRPPRT
jgi:hypothetical protein